MEKRKILIVDDEKVYGNMIKLSLELTGNYVVRSETEGAKAYPAAKEFKPDLILLDVNMPDMDGGGAAFQIKSDEGLKDVPIVFLTGLVSEKEIVSGGGPSGKNTYIPKTVKVDTLIDCIEKNVNKKRTV